MFLTVFFIVWYSVNYYNLPCNRSIHNVIRVKLFISGRLESKGSQWTSTRCCISSWKIQKKRKTKLWKNFSFFKTKDSATAGGNMACTGCYETYVYNGATSTMNRHVCKGKNSPGLEASYFSTQKKTLDN